MAKFIAAPGAAGGLSAEQPLLYANQVSAVPPGQGLFSLEQWAVIAGAGMAISLLMLIAGLIVGWRNKRRQNVPRR